MIIQLIKANDDAPSAVYLEKNPKYSPQKYYSRIQFYGLTDQGDIEILVFDKKYKKFKQPHNIFKLEQLRGVQSEDNIELDFIGYNFA